jgi:hypothetical protein
MAGWAVFSVRPSDSMFQPIMQAAVTLIVLSACLYVLLSSGKDARLRTWAMGIVATLLGYWLRGM